MYSAIFAGNILTHLILKQIIRSLETRDTSKRHKEHENCVISREHFSSKLGSKSATIDKLLDLTKKKENLIDNRSQHLDIETESNFLDFT